MDLKKSKHLIVKITENALEQRIGGPSNDFGAELKELGDLLASYEQVRNSGLWTSYAMPILWILGRYFEAAHYTLCIHFLTELGIEPFRKRWKIDKSAVIGNREGNSRSKQTI